MDYREIIESNDSVIIKGVKNFNIKQILECGQCFRWQRVTDTDYIVVSNRRVIEIIQEDDEVIIHNTNMNDFKNIWENYFDLNTEYGPLKEELSKDELLKQAIEFGYGIRLLNQDPFEMVISFIISARNSIPSIMKTIKKISEKFGDKIEYKGEIYYAFPTPEQLKNATLEDIQETGASFRSKYIIDTIYNINMALEAKKSGNLTDELKMYDLDYIMSLPTDECHVALQAFKGVGAKVADCIMLFSMGKKSKIAFLSALYSLRDMTSKELYKGCIEPVIQCPYSCVATRNSSSESLISL